MCSEKKVIALVSCPLNLDHFLADEYMAIDDLGLGYLYKALENCGYSVYLFDSIHPSPSFNSPMKDLEKRILKVHPDYIGFSDPIENIKKSLKLVQVLKTELPNLTVIYGDIHASLFSKEILENEPLVDYVICGEADRSLPMLVDALENGNALDGIPGLAYRKDKEIKSHPPDFDIDLNDLPFPYRPSLFDSRPNEKLTFNIITSRGCPNHCTFCSLASFLTYNNRHKNDRWRSRSPQSIFNEIEYLYSKGVRKLFFCDDNWIGNKEVGLTNALELCELIIKNKLDLSFFVMIRPDCLSEADSKALEIMKKAGLSMLFVGLEASNKEQLGLFGKKYDLLTAKEMINLIFKNRIMIHVTYIMFFPHSTFDSLRQNLQFLSDTGLSFLFSLYLTRLAAFSKIAIEKKLQKDDLVVRQTTYKIPGLYRFKDIRIERLYDILNSVLFPHHKTFYFFLNSGIEASYLTKTDSGIFDQYLNSMKKVGEASSDLFEFCLQQAEFHSESKDFSNDVYRYSQKWLKVIQEEESLLKDIFPAHKN